MSLRKKLLLIFALLFIAAEVSLLVLQGQTNDKTITKTNIAKPAPAEKKEADLILQKSFPIIDYSSNSLSQDEKERGKKYDKGMQAIFPEISKNEETLSTLNWAQDLTALPLEKSDVVIIGKVTDAKAIMSASKNSVFSEFKIEVEKIFKNTSRQKFENEDFIKAEREGGVVKYTSGYKNWYHAAGQLMPNIGRKYVFFVTNNFPIPGCYEKDFYLLTAYELKEGKVIPLDNPDDSSPIVLT